ncbi:MAG: glycosyltransferase family 4 protein [Thermodesulfobacteriaceae bacterium]|jgi:glycosyltransferase involved in cell wall biosynthesis
MKIGIIASELYDGGENTWTKVLCKALLKIEKIELINIYINKDYDTWVKEFSSINKIKIKKVNWNFRFGINKKNNIYKTFVRILTMFKNPLAKYLFNFTILDENDLVISPYVSTEVLFTSKKYVVCPQDTRHLHKKFHNDSSILKRIKAYLFEIAYSIRLKNAWKVIVEARYIKDDLTKYYEIQEDKIRIIISPVLINEYSIIEYEKLNVKKKYNLPEKFIFYPAHFIEDKNHINLLRALRYIKDKYNLEIPLILVGSKKNNFENAMNEIQNLGLGQQVKYLGYVPDEDMPYLYKLATALVMPTLFESVSMPIWEAFHLGCPVVSSNVCALPEQVGDAGLIFDPYNIEDMAEKIFIIWTNENLRSELINKGFERVKDLTIENYAKEWEKILEEVKNVVG